MNVNHTLHECSRTFNLAFREGRYDTVKFLHDLNSRLDLSVRYSEGFRILHRAFIKGRSEVVNILIGAVINVNVTTNACFTPLNLVCWKGHLETLTFLLDLNEQIFQFLIYYHISSINE